MYGKDLGRKTYLSSRCLGSKQQSKKHVLEKVRKMCGNQVFPPPNIGVTLYYGCGVSFESVSHSGMSVTFCLCHIQNLKTETLASTFDARRACFFILKKVALPAFAACACTCARGGLYATGSINALAVPVQPICDPCVNTPPFWFIHLVHKEIPTLFKEGAWFQVVGAKVSLDCFLSEAVFTLFGDAKIQRLLARCKPPSIKSFVFGV